MTVIKEPKKWYVKFFTLGKNFSSRTFSDNTKKFILNAIGLFLVVTFTFYVESVGDEYEKKQEYIEVAKSIAFELNQSILYAEEYKENLDWIAEYYNKQYHRWEYDNDSIFIDFMEDDEEPNGKYYFAPMSLFGSNNPFNPDNTNYKIFKKGSLEFLLINQNISSQIINAYEGMDMLYLQEITSKDENIFVDEFRKIIGEKWTSQLDYVDIDYTDFWVKNRKYIQNDKELKMLLYSRLDLWEYQVLDQLNIYKNKLTTSRNNLDSLINKMENEKYFLYWKID